MNDPDAGFLDNDKNKDGVPDFVIAVNTINLKTKMVPSIIHSDDICFAVSITDNYDLTFHFDDSDTSIGRT